MSIFSHLYSTTFPYHACTCTNLQILTIKVVKSLKRS
nr:MAG TPA: hypothetical protein [Caudoviricetes sp.]